MSDEHRHLEVVEYDPNWPIEVVKAKHGYIDWPYKDDVMQRFCKPSDSVRIHHLHMIPAHSDMFRERLYFRDATRRDADLRTPYAALKYDLAVR